MHFNRIPGRTDRTAALGADAPPLVGPTCRSAWPRRSAALPNIRGVALVITLIMLSMITFMAVTFLVLSHRERGAVTTTTDQTTAGFTAETAMERAKAEILARIVALTNDQNFDLIVSTNFVNYGGFDPNPFDYRTNVNYNFLTVKEGGGPLNAAQALQNLGDLLFDPRPPVFVVTNSLYPTNTDFRYYLDSNRNGRYDTNGMQPEFILVNGQIQLAKSNNIVISNYYVGDPEWIGVLEHPDQPHSADNKFLARYAYIVLPAGKTLDLNYIHNEVESAVGGLNRRAMVGGDFRRNQGVGTWEINLAAFLYDLNTNVLVWGGPGGYTYNLLGSPLTVNGNTFADAESIYSYRLNGSLNGAMSLTNARALFTNGATAFFSDNIDEYSDGPFMLGNAITAELPRDPVAAPWAGADNPYHYFSPQELFNPLEVSSTFVNRMLYAGSQNDSYDRYTFYRLLAQLGTDSAPEQNKININYANLDTNGIGIVVPGMETNLISWANASAPAKFDNSGVEMFFNVAADRLLRTNSSIWLGGQDTNAYFQTFGVLNVFGLTTNATGVTGIPVLASIPYFTNTVIATNYIFGYTPGVHHLLQLAANIYDATTTNFYPSVFRPIFRRNPGPFVTNVFIVGYRLEVNPSVRLLNMMTNVMVDLTDNNSSDASWNGKIPALGVPLGFDVNEPLVYGIPFVIGAKKGFPNFNKYALENAVTASRKLEFHRLLDQPVSETNQMYTLSVSNSFGVQAWNSYSNQYPRPLRMIISGDVTLALTNASGTILDPNGIVLNRDIPFSFFTNFPIQWPGFAGAQANPPISFRVPILTNDVFLTNSAFVCGRNRFFNFPTGDLTNHFPIPQWWLYEKTRLRYLLIDPAANRIIDYVNLSSEASPLNVLDALQTGALCNFAVAKQPDGEFWCTNRVDGSTNDYIATWGMINQIQVSEGAIPVSSTIWAAYSLGGSGDPSVVHDEQMKFLISLIPGGPQTNLNFQTPFNPSRTVFQYVDWQANDPLVHYTVPDLTDLFSLTNVEVESHNIKPVAGLVGAAGTSAMATHYRPWGGNPSKESDTTPSTAKVMALKDPLPLTGKVKGCSDYWDFPTNKFPNVGWLGRVHRGSPWQTIYLKASDSPMNTLVNPPVPLYAKWSGTTNAFDAIYMSKPVNDRLLFDIFTTAVHDNAARGQLSVNQANLAAWSAVLSGVIVLTNSQSGTIVGPQVIAPAGIYDLLKPLTNPVVQIWQGINSTRSNTTTNGPVFANHVFNHVGDVLATPQLTERSPFLFTNNITTVSDEVAERIPQQIMGLLNLSHTPRFVIYSYGQTLHPADHSIYTGSGPYFGLCTNYQITAEMDTRAVVRVEGAPTNPHIVVEQFNVLPPD